MKMRSMDTSWPIGQMFGLGAEDIAWMLGLCAGTLIVAAMLAMYVLLFF
jgi:hypothetical protein